jgi:hypothetical protein
MMRLKAFPENRFHDRALIYYAAEYRVIPAWTPPGRDTLRFLDLQWWQFVVLGELGRVAHTWNIPELHTNMKWDAGLGLRGMFGTGVARMDFVYGNEGLAIQAMFGQSF